MREANDTYQWKEALFYRDEFLAIASHELKTPLTSLKLHSQIFKRRVKREDPEAYSKERIDQLMDQIDLQVSRLTSLVDDMLDISRIRTGKLSITKDKTSLSHLVADLVTMLSGDIRTELDPSVEVFCDRLRIGQVIRNLLNNALRYGNGKPIEVKLFQKEQLAYIKVRDYGIGISQEAQAMIFDKFKRGIPASEVSGLGLGLFISKQVLLAHGGRIEVESELNEGSTFTVILPVEEA